MDTTRLIKDCAIVASVLLVGALLYFSFPSRTEQLLPDDTSVPLTNNNNMMEQPTAQLKIDILAEGAGAGAQSGQTIAVHYTGKFADGKEFDSSVKRNVPFTFQLGQGRVIKGWDLGVVGMKVGEERKLTIPFELAYGADGFPPTIPPKATLTYVISLLKIATSGK